MVEKTKVVDKNIKNKILRLLDEHVENALIFPMYFMMMAIMAVGVIQRFVFNTAFHWAVYVCIALFVWLTWLGCSWNVKERSHLRLSAFRNKMPRGIQLCLLMLDYSLWIGFGAIVTYYSIDQIELLYRIGAVVYGTESIPKWIVPLCIPIAFSVLFVRVIQCAVQDVKDYINKRPLKMEPTTTVDV